MKKLLLIAAFVLGAAFVRAGEVNIVTPDGIIVGHVGGDFTMLTTPQGMITGSNPVIVNLPSASVVIGPSAPAAVLSPQFVPQYVGDGGLGKLSPWEFVTQHEMILDSH
jgi:hypothetical protein